MGRFEKILPTGGSVAFQYKYDAASNEVERDNLSNSVNQFYTRDVLSRMSERDVKLNTTVLSSEAYGYDAMSRMVSVAREDGKTDAFTYYLDGELWTANYGNPNPTRTVTYNIDQMGNRTSVIDTGVTTTYGQAAGGLNQYSQVGAAAVTNGSEHEIASYQGNAYGYINDERLSSIASGGNTYTLGYDALGRCVSRTLNGATMYYIYDGEKPIVEYNSAGSVIARNLYGKAIDEILMRVDASLGTFYYQDDHEGSVTQLTSSSGGILEKYRFDVFGAPSMYDVTGNPINASAYNNRFLFTGREYTSTFGVYEYRARAYHPGLGRFTGEDPTGFDAGDYNLFRYCHNDPEDLTDPMGLAGIGLDPDVQALEDRAIHMVVEASRPWRYVLTPPEHAVSIWRDDKTQRANVSSTKRGPWGPWAALRNKADSIVPPTKPGKTNKEEVHAHMFHLGDGDVHTRTQMSANDIKRGNKHGPVQVVVDIRTGDQWRFRPDTNLQLRAGNQGGTIDFRANGTRNWTPSARANTDMKGVPLKGDTNAAHAAQGAEPTGGTTTANTVQTHSHSVGDTGESDGNFSQMPRHIP